jgi:hypothetical protein
MLSFYDRQDTPHNFHLIAGLGNLLRKLFRRERVELGDDLTPNYVHYFTESQLASELVSAGFQLACYSTRSYGHAVAIAAA